MTDGQPGHGQGSAAAGGAAPWPGNCPGLASAEKKRKGQGNLYKVSGNSAELPARFAREKLAVFAARQHPSALLTNWENSRAQNKQFYTFTSYRIPCKRLSADLNYALLFMNAE